MNNAQLNQTRLFAASCMALLVTSMTFAIRVRLESVFGPVGFGLTLEQIGVAMAPAFWGFTLAMIVGGPIVDFIGMKRGAWIAFACHAAGIVTTLMAKDLNSLFIATLLMGLGNGMVEAVCNPLVAAIAPPDQKIKKLNHFHLWFPAGIVTGALAGYLLMDVVGLSWQVLVGILVLPLLVYGYLFFGQSFPVTERVSRGVSMGDTFKGLFSPLYLLIAFCVLLSTAAELGTTQRIESILQSTGVNGLLVLAFINGIMMLGRAFSGPICARIEESGILWGSAIVSFVGLQLLSVSSGPFVFVAAAVFAIGVTFFWPTTVGFIAHNKPETGAVGMSLIMALGMLSVSIVLPIVGRIMDNSTGSEALRVMSILPGILIVLYGALFFSRRKAAPAAADA